MPQILDFTQIAVFSPADGRQKLGCSDFATDLAGITSDDIKEGKTHLFWTQSRFSAAFAKAIANLPSSGGLTAAQVNALIVAAFPGLFATAFQTALSSILTVIDGNGDSDADALDFNSDDYTTILDCNGL